MDTRAAKRQSNRRPELELLRIVAMLMVMTAHYLDYEGMLPTSERFDGLRIAGTFAEALVINAGCVYAMLSGYLTGHRSGLRRIPALVGQVYFYSIAGAVAAYLTGLAEPARSAWDLWPILFPFGMEHYWYMSAYLVILLFSPMVAVFLDHSSERSQMLVLLGMLLLFGAGPSLSPVRLALDKAGVDFFWLFTQFYAGALLRRFEGKLTRFMGRRGLLIYIASVLAIALSSLLLWTVSLRTGGLLYYREVPLHENFLPNFFSALGLTLCFMGIRIRSERAARICRALGPMTFGVYLIHQHMYVRAQWTGLISRVIGERPENALAFLHLIGTVAIGFAACIFIDWVRREMAAFCRRILPAVKTRKGTER